MPFDRRVWLESQGADRGRLPRLGDLPDGRRRTRALRGARGRRTSTATPRRRRPRARSTTCGEFLYCWLQHRVAVAQRVARAAASTSSTPATRPTRSWLLGAVLQAVRRKRFLFDQHDLCPEVFLSRFGSRRRLLHRGPAAGSSACTYATADLVIATNESYRRGRDRPRPASIPSACWSCAPAPSAARFAGAGAAIPALKRGKRFLVAYLGVMAPQDGVDYLLRARAR